MRTNLAGDPEDGDIKSLSRSNTMSPIYEARLVTFHSNGSDEISLLKKIPTPVIPRKSSRRNLGKGHGNSFGASSRVVKGCLTKSQTVNTNSLGQHRILPSVAASYSTRDLTSKLPRSPLYGNADADEINRKIASVFEATAVLKGNVELPAEQTPNIMGRLKSTKTFTKISKVWSDHFRIHPKAKVKQGALNDQNGELLYEQPEKTGCKPRPATLEPLLLPEDEPPTTIMKMRLNAGRNLNGDKIRDLTGGKHQRKPLHSDGKSFKSGDSFEDPFSESHTSDRSLTFFEARLKDQALQSSGIEAWKEDFKKSSTSMIFDPFEAEGLFDRRIDDLLESPPTASSTPRLRLKTISKGKVRLQKSRTGLNRAIRPPANSFSCPQMEETIQAGSRSPTELGKSTPIRADIPKNVNASSDLLAQRPDETG